MAECYTVSATLYGVMGLFAASIFLTKFWGLQEGHSYDLGGHQTFACMLDVHKGGHPFQVTALSNGSL
jgi:hypothetical protein